MLDRIFGSATLEEHQTDFNFATPLFYDLWQVFPNLWASITSSVKWGGLLESFLSAWTLWEAGIPRDLSRITQKEILLTKKLLNKVVEKK